MGKPIGKHSDGSNCYTKNCSRMMLPSVSNESKSIISPYTVQKDVLSALLPKPGTVRKGLNGKNGLDSLEELHQLTDDYLEQLSAPERNLLARYKHTSFRYVNDYLNGGKAFLKKHYLQRKGKKMDDQEADEYVEHAVKTVPELDRVLAKYSPDTKKYRTLYRAFTVYPPKNITKNDSHKFINDYVKENYQVGAVITNNAYSSTSADSDYMLVAASESSAPIIVHEIVSNKGVPIFKRFRPHNKSIQNAEKEMLIPRGAKFQIVNVSEETFETSYSPSAPLPFQAWGKPVRKRKFVVVQMIQI